MGLSSGLEERRESYTAPMRGGVDAGVKGVCLAVAWLLGMAVHLQQAQLPGEGVHAALLVTGALLLAVGLLRRGARVWLAVIGAALAAFSLAGLQANARLAQRLDAVLEGQDIAVTASSAACRSSPPTAGVFAWPSRKRACAARRCACRGH